MRGASQTALSGLKVDVETLLRATVAALAAGRSL